VDKKVSDFAINTTAPAAATLPLVPELSTWMMIGSGLTLLIVASRRRRQSMPNA
jgi:hypothetical protein